MPRVRRDIGGDAPGWFIVASCLLMAACGGSAPTAPSNERVSGAWIGNATLTSAAGGECVGDTLRAVLGSRDIFSARIQQNGTELAASVTYQGNRTSCVYTGSTQGSTLALNGSSCPSGRVDGFRCTNGSLRDLEVTAGRVEARIAGRSGNGTDTTTLNVFAPGSASPVGVLTVSSQFIWNALGIPHDDFHIFDGSILPGYVDGVTIIPEEPNPFCTKCGWF